MSSHCLSDESGAPTAGARSWSHPVGNEVQSEADEAAPLTPLPGNFLQAILSGDFSHSGCRAFTSRGA
jgi:hypothetical protein